MADKETIDSKKPVRSLTREVLDKIHALSPQVRAAADAAGVSPLAVAGPMAREMNRKGGGWLHQGVEAGRIAQNRNILASIRRKDEIWYSSSVIIEPASRGRFQWT